MFGRYLMLRLLLAIPTIFCVAVIVFVLMRIVPGDPISMMIPPGASPDDIENLREIYGLNKPVLDQFLIWLNGIAEGDLGRSISLKLGVGQLILNRLPATLELVILSMGIAIFLAVTASVAAIRYKDTLVERVLDTFTGVAQAIPDFLWSLLLLLFFGVILPLFPITGRLDPSLSFDPITNFYFFEAIFTFRLDVVWDLLAHLALPSFALAFPLAASLSRVLRGSLSEAMSQDYITLAQVKGYSRLEVITKFALRNALIPTITLSGVQFAFLIGGTVLVEYIFSYPGLGNLAISAVVQRDLPLIQGLILTFAVMFVITNLLIDLSYALINPRLRGR